jgi:ABC-type sugar transport system permease subunit
MSKALRKPQFRFGALVLAPILAWYVLLSFRPVVLSFRTALVDYRLLGPQDSQWVGLEHFMTLFTSYKLFWKVAKNTLTYAAIMNVVSVPLAMLFALCLSKVSRRARDIYQGVLFLPVVVSMAAMSIIFKVLMDPSGILNHILGLAGIPPSKWLASPDTALFSLALVAVWKELGGNTVILAAGMLAIPREMYDAARVDGANAWQVFWKITVPLLMPTLKLVSVIVAIGSLQAYTSAVILIGPVNSTLMISQFVMTEAFDHLRFGLASAAAFTLFVTIFTVTLFQMRLMKQGWEY